MGKSELPPGWVHRLIVKWGLIPLLLTALVWTGLPLPAPVYASNDMVLTGYVRDETGRGLSTRRVTFWRVNASLQPIDYTSQYVYTDSTGRYTFPAIWFTTEDLIKHYRLDTDNPGVTGGKSYIYDNFAGGTVTHDIGITVKGTSLIHLLDEAGSPVPAGVPLWITYSGLSSSSGWPWNAPSDEVTPHHTTDGSGNVNLTMNAAWTYDGSSLGGFDYAYAAGQMYYGGINQAYNMIDNSGTDRTSALRYELPADPALRRDVMDVSAYAGRTTEYTFYVRPLGQVAAVATDAVTGQSLPGVYWNYQSGSGFKKYPDYSSDSSGFSIYGYPGDTITITASSAANPVTGYLGYQPVTDSAVVDAWGVKSVSFALQPNQPGTLSGLVTDQEGTGIAGATVKLIWPGYSEYTTASYEGGDLVLQTATTNTAGEYSFAGVVPASGYQVSVTKPGYGLATRDEISLGSGESRPLSNLVINLDEEPPYWYNGDELFSETIGRTGLVLEWPKAQDGTGVTGYRIYQGAVLLEDPDIEPGSWSNTLRLKVTNLTTETTYEFSVTAYDGAGNVSAPLTATFTTGKPYDPQAKVIRASVSSEGIGADEFSSNPSISADGRFVVFESYSDSLVEGDANTDGDIFLFDRVQGQLSCLSRNPAGATGDGDSFGPAISGDGRYIVFASDAPDLTADDNNDTTDVFFYDTSTATLERISLGLDGAEADNYSYAPSISDDGRYVAFVSRATNLVAGDTNGRADAFVHDRTSGTTVRVSYQPNGNQVTNTVYTPAISGNGQFVAYNNGSVIYIYDRVNQTTELVTRKYSNPSTPGYGSDPAISADGRFVVFYSGDSGLVQSDTNNKEDIFIYDRDSTTTQLVSVSSAGTQGNNYSTYPSISADGCSVAFKSLASNLVAGDTNGYYDVFVRDLTAGTTERVSLAADGAEGDDDSSWEEGPPVLSSDGRYVVFDSYAANLVPGDSNYECDIFIYDRLAGTVVPLPGDIDGDDDIDIDDLLLLAQAYRTIEGQTGFESRFDLNGDKVVDIYDLLIVARQLR